MGNVRDSFHGMVKFKCWFRGGCKGSTVIIDVSTEMNYRCNYMQVKI